MLAEWGLLVEARMPVLGQLKKSEVNRNRKVVPGLSTSPPCPYPPLQERCPAYPVHPPAPTHPYRSGAWPIHISPPARTGVVPGLSTSPPLPLQEWRLAYPLPLPT